MSTTKIAMLDDYIGIGLPYYAHIPNIQMDEYRDTILPNTPESTTALVERLKPYSIILSMRERTPFPRSVLSRLPNLKLLQTTGPRNLGIDVRAAHDHGIIVAGTSGLGGQTHPALPAEMRERATAIPQPDPSYDGTTQQTFALLLSLSTRIPLDHARLTAGGRGGAWQERVGFSLAGRTYGALGLGRLGSRAARTAVLGFGMRVVAWSANLTQAKADETCAALGLAKGTVRVLASKEELLRTADVVSLHYILSERSRGMIGAQELALMKPDAVLVNTSRGPLVDEHALLEVLRKGRIRGAALDVFDEEPLPLDSPWRTVRWGEGDAADVVISPHMGYGVEEMLHRMYAEQSLSLERYLRGEELSTLLK